MLKQWLDHLGHGSCQNKTMIVDPMLRASVLHFLQLSNSYEPNTSEPFNKCDGFGRSILFLAANDSRRHIHVLA